MAYVVQLEGINGNRCQSSVFYLAPSLICGEGLLVILEGRFFALRTLAYMVNFPRSGHISFYCNMTYSNPIKVKSNKTQPIHTYIHTNKVTGFAKTRHLRTKQISEISEKQKNWVSEHIPSNHIYTKTNSLRSFSDSFRSLACSQGELFCRIRPTCRKCRNEIIQTPNKSIDLFLTWRVVMAAKEVVSALHVLTSDAPLSCKAWPDSSLLRRLLQITLPEVTTMTRNPKYLIVTTTVFPLVSIH